MAEDQKKESQDQPSPTDDKSGKEGKKEEASQYAQLSIDEKNRLLANQAALINELRTGKQQTDSRLAELERAAKAPPAPTAADITKANKAFFDNPVPTMKELIKQELAESVKPLIEFRNEVKAQSVYDRLKTGFKANPKFTKMLSHPEVEAVVDSLMGSNPPTEAAMYSILAGVRGAIELGDMPKPSGWDGDGAGKSDDPKTGNKQTVKTQIPPHLRPSSPPGPEHKEGEKQVRDLTENERRLARENGLTPEEYLESIGSANTQQHVSEAGALILKENYGKKKPAEQGAK